LTAPAPLACPVSVSYQTHNLTATAGQDYGTAAGLLTFPAGSPSGTTRPIAVSLLDDLVAAGDEAFTVALATPIGAGLGPVSATTVTVLDNDPASSVSINDASATEAAGAHARFTIGVSPVNSQPLTFTYATAKETATGGLDYPRRAGR
jgi:hypothetical protein